MPDAKRPIGRNFVFVPYVSEFLTRTRKAEEKATKQATIVMQRFAQKNTPFRTGTNARSIKSKTKGSSGIVWTTSGYGFWLEVVDRIYERGIKGYLRGAFLDGAKAYPAFLEKALLSGTKFRPPFPKA